MSQPIPSSIAGRYRVIRELGRGGFGAVYLVEHAHTGDHLALKILYGQAARDPMSLERFKREARAAAKIKSDNVVRVTDADAAPELDGAPFLVMELLDGRDVEAVVEARGALLPEEVVGILSEAARALDKAHSLGIVHRDLKPENLFLHKRDDGSYIVKILDFGISKATGDASGGDLGGIGKTSTGAVLGTPLYMAPEQARGIASAISPQTDMWAIGLMAFRLLSGHSYWRANTVADLLVQIVAGELVKPSTLARTVPPAFDAWFLRSCDRDPAKRWRTVGEQIAALAAALRVTTPSVPSVDVPPISAIALGTMPTIASSDLPPMGRSTGAALSRTAVSGRGRTRLLAWSLGVTGVGAVITIGLLVATRSTTDTKNVLQASATPSEPVAVPASAPPVVTPVAPSAPSAASATSASASPVASAPPVSAGKKPGLLPHAAPRVEPASPPPTQPAPPQAKPPKHFDPDAP